MIYRMSGGGGGAKPTKPQSRPLKPTSKPKPTK